MERIAVMGLGITGRAVAVSLQRRGVDIVALDDRISDDLRAWSQETDIDVHAPESIDVAATLKTCDAIVPAPGLPDHHSIFAVVRAAGVPVWSEFDLAVRWDDRPTVAVTGTDGKTTVVTLIDRMLNRSGISSTPVGNTDTPYIEAIDRADYDVFVVEASSFRLGYSQSFSPNVGAWLNFGPDHLDAHTGIDAYELAKASIWRDRQPGMLALANRDDDVVMRNAKLIDDVDVETFGASVPACAKEHGLADGALVVAGAELVRVDELPRSMPHDLMNALAAAACSLRVGADRSAVAQVLREFDGLDHRVQLVAEIDGVRYVNDSKATTPHAAAAALGGFASIILLAGGKNKGLAFDDMLNHVDRIRHVVAIGHSAADIEAVFAGRAPTSVATSMEEAVTQARTIAETGDVVLLSPACASFDWYRNYKHRGEDFIRIVRYQQTQGASS